MSLYAEASMPVDNYRTEIKTANHTVIADEPADVGGKDLAPTPRELLLGSLAACTAITLKMYIARKEWPVEAADVRVELIESEDRKVQPTVKRTIKFTGATDAEQVQRLLKIADACPVHKLLSASLTVETSAV